MNAINKVGRPIIPSRSSDESFSSDHVRERMEQDGGRVRGGRGESRWRRQRRRRRKRKSGNARCRRMDWVAFGQFVIKLKIPSAEETDERVTNGRDRNGSSTGRRHVTTDKRRTGVYLAPLLRRAALPNFHSPPPLSLSPSSLPLSSTTTLAHWISLGGGGRRWGPSSKKFVRAIQHHRDSIRDTHAGIEADIISINSPISTL